MAKPTESGFKNPFDDAYYREHFGPFETDGFQEWASHQGYTLFNLDFLSLVLILLTIPLCGVLYLMIHWFSAMLPIAVTLLLRGHQRLRTQYGPAYVNVLMWKAGLPPFNGFMPFDVPLSGKLVTLNLSYEYEAHSHSNGSADRLAADPAPHSADRSSRPVHGQRS